MKTYVVFGASKGLGDAFVRGVPQQGDKVWVVARSRPKSLDLEHGIHWEWIPADLYGVYSLLAPYRRGDRV